MKVPSSLVTGVHFKCDRNVNSNYFKWGIEPYGLIISLKIWSWIEIMSKGSIFYDKI